MLHKIVMVGAGKGYISLVIADFEWAELNCQGCLHGISYDELVVWGRFEQSFSAFS